MQRLDAGACLDREMTLGLKEAVCLWESKCRGDGAMVRDTRERRRFDPGKSVNFGHVEDLCVRTSPEGVSQEQCVLTCGVTACWTTARPLAFSSFPSLASPALPSSSPPLPSPSPSSSSSPLPSSLPGAVAPYGRVMKQLCELNDSAK